MQITRAEILLLVEKAKAGRNEPLEDTLLALFEKYGSAPAVSKAIGITPATLYRWLDGPARDLGRVLNESGVIHTYNTTDKRREKLTRPVNQTNNEAHDPSKKRAQM